MLPVEEPQEEMSLPVSDSAKSRKHLHSHALLITFCNLFERALKDESGDPGPALASNLLCSLKCLLIYNLKALDQYLSKFLISNTEIL